MSKTHLDKYSLVVSGMLIISSLWFLVVLGWSIKTLVSMRESKPIEPVSGNLQQQSIQNAIELFSSLTESE